MNSGKKKCFSCTQDNNLDRGPFEDKVPGMCIPGNNRRRIRFMKKAMVMLYTFVVALALIAQAAYGQDVATESMAKKLNDVLIQGTSQNHWQIKVDEVSAMMKDKKTDFLIVDVRPNPKEYKDGHFPGSIYIPYNEILKSENLGKLPKDKKVILLCVTGQNANLPIVALRALGYNAYTMVFGYTAWIKDYRGGKLMQEAIQGAATNNYPIEK